MIFASLFNDVNILNTHAFACANNGTRILRLKDIFQDYGYTTCPLIQYPFNGFFSVLRNELLKVGKQLNVFGCHTATNLAILRERLRLAC
jgi:hypothetical protein